MESNSNAAGTAPAAGERVVKAADVVAVGAGPRFLQLPSPVYLAEWVSPTHVLIGAGGGGSRFGMANVLVMLSIHTEPSAVGGGAAQRPVRLTAAQHKAVDIAPKKGNAGTSADGLWQFVTALDLGGDVPWCSSSFLPYDDADAGEGEGGGHFALSAAQRAGLRGTVGFIALSSIRTFTLVAVDRRPAFAMRKLAHIPVPNDPHNPDKKPLALVHHAVVVAHDDKGVLLFDLAELVPADGASGVVTDARPLAEWALPARANDLHANRINLVEAKAAKKPKADEGIGASSGPAVKALLYDFLLVAAAVQDKTVRLASFRLRRDYGPPSAAVGAERARRREEQEDSDRDGEPPVPVAAAAGSAPPSAYARPRDVIEDPVSAPFQLLPGGVFSAEALGLPFQPLASSFRLVRLFGLENLSPWAGAAESARRRATNFSLTARVEGATLPAVSLLLMAYDQRNNQSYLVAVMLNAALAFVGVVPWWHDDKEDEGASSATNVAPLHAGPGEIGAVHAQPHGRGKISRRRTKREHPVAVFSATPYAGPSPIVKDCITCLAAAHDCTVATECTNAIGRNPFGAALPLSWLAGTVDGYLVRIAGRELSQPLPQVAHAKGSAPAAPALPAGRIAFAGAQARPDAAAGSVKRRFPALHKEPITAVAVSTQNDVLSTDLAQNVAVSAMPFTLIPPRTRRVGGKEEVTAPAVTKQKENSLALFPPPSAFGGAAGAIVDLLSGDPHEVVLRLALPVGLLAILVFLILIMII